MTSMYHAPGVVAWVISRASTLDKAHIRGDGKKITTVAPKPPTVTYRDAIWTKRQAENAKHTVKVLAAVTSGHLTLTTDGIVCPREPD